MKIHFFVRFHTEFGQQLTLAVSMVDQHGKTSDNQFPMNYYNGEFWHYMLDVPGTGKAGGQIRYQYAFRQDNLEAIHEWGNDRVLNLADFHVSEIHLIDTWNHAGEYENVFFSAPYRDILLRRTKRKYRKPSGKSHTHFFKVKAPLCGKDEEVCLLGSASSMGSWKSSQAIRMTKENGWWVTQLKLKNEHFPVEYKYGIYNAANDQFVQYESGNNRILYDTTGVNKLTVLHDGFAHFPNNTWRGCGVAIPVFSLRTNKSFGIGEFTDLPLLVDWARKMGMHMIQLLPVNDTTSTHTWMDSYPYSAISAFALHPIYLNLEKVAGKEFMASIRSLKRKQKQLNELPDIDYEEVLRYKNQVIRDLYLLLKDQVFATSEYQSFFNQNRHWLVPYAAFSYLRDKYKSSDFLSWKHLSAYDPKAVEKLCHPAAKHYDQIGIHYFIQYHLHLQLREAHEYANNNGIILKGDIPIGINRYGVDAWMEPELYKMDVQAGAPPDDFAVKGQNWGFPTYNWSRMQEGGFQWWKNRFAQMSNYFDAFRIDHILGFFRIWSIPVHAVEGIMGHFEPCIPVHIVEFSERGIWFDYDRYCRPFITDAVLWEMFGPNERNFKPFLDAMPDGSYAMKPEFATQKLVELFFTNIESSEEQDRIKQGLYDLISNVIFFEEVGSERSLFHFRFNMDQTASFRYLEWNTQQQLKDLYVNYFFGRQDEFWKREAMKKLPALKRTTEMLICGEDLGLVPGCVPDVMKQLGILSLEIQRMPKDPRGEFFHPNDAPYLSVVTPSTHDMSTIRGWWEEDRAKIQRFYHTELGQYGEAPVVCEARISKTILLQHLYSPAQWCVFQMQDLFGINEQIRRNNPDDERINVPANPRHYWRYRMHIKLEELMKLDEFNEELRGYLYASGRNNF
jgi:4-alpha-glucanotransferase